MNQDLLSITDFIVNNPPTNEDGEIDYWPESYWEKYLNNQVQNWRRIIAYRSSGKEIKKLRSRGSYSTLLYLILPYIDPKIFIEYLNSPDDKEVSAAFSTLISNCGKRLTNNYWSLFDQKTKTWIINRIFNDIRGRMIDIDSLLFRIRDFTKYHYDNISDPKLIQSILDYNTINQLIYEPTLNLTDPVWNQLKYLVNESKDEHSLKIIFELESNAKFIIKNSSKLIRRIFYKRNFSDELDTENISRNIMFDPSLLFSIESLEEIKNFIDDNYYDYKFYIPNSFLKILTSIVHDNQWLQIPDQFGIDDPNDPEILLNFISSNLENRLNFFSIPEIHTDSSYINFQKRLSEIIENDFLINILIEEWLFLNKYSWIVSKTKKTFKAFNQAGAVSIEFSKKAIDTIIRKTLKKKETELVNTHDKLRALAKWSAVGGASATSFFNPVLATAITSTTGIFLLLDP